MSWSVLLPAHGLCQCARPPPRPRRPRHPALPHPVPQALLALVGSTACVTFSYFFPGALVLKCQSGWALHAGAVCMIALGVVMAAVAIANQLSGHGE